MQIHMVPMNNSQSNSWCHAMELLKTRIDQDPLFKPEEFGRLSGKYGFGFIEYIFCSYMTSDWTDDEFKRYYGIDDKFLNKLKKRMEDGVAKVIIRIEDK